MKIREIIFPDFPEIKKPPILIPGNFDGVHLGHKALIEEGKKLRKIFKTKLILLSFEPHPYIFFHKSRKNFLITDIKEKKEILKKYGVDEIWLMDFNKKLAETPPEIFATKLLELPLSRLILGPDHTFGKDRKGNIFTIIEIAREKGKVVTIFPYITYKNRKISSIRIRELIEEGEIEIANKLLGYKYFLTGIRIKGKGRGKKLGYPTINFSVPEEKLKPKPGVYIIEAKIKNKKYKGLMYYGSRPTFNEKEKIFELYLFDFKGNIKEKKLKVFLHKFIREDMKFENEGELVKQIEKDINIGYTYFLKKGSNPFNKK